MTILSRNSSFSDLRSSELNSIQAQVDGGVGRFVEEAANPATLTAVMAGGMAYRLGRLGFMSAASDYAAALPFRMASRVVGLGSEVSTYEFSRRSLASLSSEGEGVRSTNLWSWSGPAGWAQGLGSSAITFGLLRSGGFLAREENLVFQHSLQSAAMVVGHQVASRVGVLSQPEGDLAQQFLHAEATNLQMSAGMSLAHAAAPRLMALDRGMEMSIDSAVQAGLPRREIPFSRGQERGAPLALEMASVGSESLEGPAENPARLNIMMAEKGRQQGGASSSRRQRSEFWFPTRGRKSLNLDYPGEREGQIAELERQVRQANQDLEKVTTREELLSRRPDENLVNAIWFHQLRHFARVLGAEVQEFIDPEQLLKPLVPGLGVKHPEFLRRAVRLLRQEGFQEEAFRVIELKIPFENVNFGKPTNKDYSTELIYVLDLIEGELRNTVRLARREKGEGFMMVRIMSPSLLDRLFQVVHGPEAPFFHYVEGEIPRDLAMKLKTLGAAPIGLGRSSLRLGDLDVKVHPWFFTLHDFFHASMVSSFPRPLREFIGWLYGAVQSDRRLTRSPLLRGHLDRLSDMDPPREEGGASQNFFGHTLGHLPKLLKDDFQADRLTMGRILQYRKFLKSYQDFLTSCRPGPAQWKVWHGEIAEEVEKLLGDLDDMIDEITRAYRDFLKQK